MKLVGLGGHSNYAGYSDQMASSFPFGSAK